MLTIRPVVQADLAVLSEFWYDNIALLQQSNSRIRLLPDARHVWEDAAEQFITANNTVFLTAINEAEHLGYVLGRITPNQAGLAPEKIGVIDALMLDLHIPHKQHSTGRILLDAAKAYFIDHHITQIQVTVSAKATVAQGFWLSMGAKNLDDVFWMTL